MAEQLPLVTLIVDGRPISAPCGANLAAVLMEQHGPALCRSVAGEPRGPLCGMGICFECRVEVNGIAHVRACMQACSAGLVVNTGMRSNDRAAGQAPDHKGQGVPHA